jgi:hypothetical protein
MRCRTRSGTGEKQHHRPILAFHTRTEYVGHVVGSAVVGPRLSAPTEAKARHPCLLPLPSPLPFRS